MKTYLALIFTTAFVLTGCQDKSASIEADPTAVASAPSEVAAPTIPSTSLTREIGKDELPSEPNVGTLTGGKIISTGKAGYLIYGPYVALDAGTYQVTLDGTLDSLPDGSHITVDVVSNRGNNTLGSAEISSAPINGESLATFLATVPPGVTDMEIRVQVPENGHVSISGYQVQPKQ